MRLIRLFLLALAMSIGSGVQAVSVIDAGAQIVELRTSCGVNGDDIPNCFTNADDLLVWIWNTRSPIVSASNPLIVNIGPGEFSLPTATPFCENKGHITLRGAGRENTRIINMTDDASAAGAAMRIINCDNLAVQDLSIIAATTGIWWEGGGSSSWSNVFVSGGRYGWYDTQQSGNGVHYWFGSKVATNDLGNTSGLETKIAYETKHSETWFYGGEIAASGNSNQQGAYVNAVLGVWVLADGDFRAFGTAIRVSDGGNPTIIGGGITPSVMPGLDSLAAVHLSGGEFHIHGGILSVNATTAAAGTKAVGLSVTSGLAHTPDTAFNILGNPGVAKVRVQQTGGTVSSPFQWPASDSPPSITSKTGYDTYIDTSGEHPHLMIFDEACSSIGGKWFDTVTNNCRGE